MGVSYELGTSPTGYYVLLIYKRTVLLGDFP